LMGVMDGDILLSRFCGDESAGDRDLWRIELGISSSY